MNSRSLLNRRACLVAVGFTLSFLASTGQTENWPQWRGEGRAGLWREVQLPEQLCQDKIEKRWSTGLGGGFSGIAVVDGKVLTMDQQKDRQLERVVCLLSQDGSNIWTHEYEADYGDLDWGNGPRSTPTVYGHQVYTLGTLGRLTCLRLLDGKRIWSIDLQETFGGKHPVWGHAASPLVANDLVYVQAGGKPGATVVAIDCKTGEERWRVLNDRPGYSSPLIAQIDGLEQLLIWTADSLVGLDPSSGSQIWRVPFRTSNYDVAIISPVTNRQRVFISGYWDGGAVYDLKSTASPVRLWRSSRISCLMSTPLTSGNYLYVLDKRDGFLCVDWRNGNILWKDEHQLTPKRRNPHATLVWAQPSTLGDDSPSEAVAIDALGDFILVRLTPKGFEDRGRVRIIEGQGTPIWAPPAFSGQNVYVRSDREILSIRVLAK